MAIEIRDLALVIGRRTVLEIPRLDFPHGTTTALFGPNGSGKTSLLRLIARLDAPTTGTVSAPRVAMAFQRPVFVRGTVAENLELGLALQRLSWSERRDRVLEAGAAFGFEHLLDRPVDALSAGEAQRVNLARALCLRAPVTLLDEPLAGVDRIARARLLEELPTLLRTFATTTIVVTHDREEAFRLAEHLVVLVDGEVRASGPAGGVYRTPPDADTAELLGYAIIPSRGEVVAVPPGGLRMAEHGDLVELVVERAVDMGNHLDVIGMIGGARVPLRLPSGAPVPLAGARLKVSVHGGVRFPRASVTQVTGTAQQLQSPGSPPTFKLSSIPRDT